jgi:hypothetical protein
LPGRVRGADHDHDRAEHDHDRAEHDNDHAACRGPVDVGVDRLRHWLES